jgi:hypothetical protein
MPVFTNLAADLQIWESASAQPAIYERFVQPPLIGVAPQRAPIPVWLQSVLNPQAPVDVDSISRTVEATFDALSNSGPSAIDVQGFDPNFVQGEHLAAVLRVTYRWRQHVLGWEQALAVAEAALRRQGVDARDALTGLIP